MWGQAIAGVSRQIVDLVLPPLCPACQRPVAENGALCAECWSGLETIERPLCDRLGIPLPFEVADGVLLSAEAIAHPPVYDRARAAVLYGDVARELVHALKYRDRQETSLVMARAMARACAELFEDADALVPVPLHRSRLFSRRYNQSAILAQTIARCAPAAPAMAWRMLLRTKPTRQQVGLSAGERADNVRGAFKVPAEAPVSGRNLILVDDVLTSGATVSAAARALKKAGAARVDVAVFARVMDGPGEPG